MAKGKKEERNNKKVFPEKWWKKEISTGKKWSGKNESGRIVERGK